MQEEELKKIFQQKKKSAKNPSGFSCSFENFKNWFNPSIFKKGCYYCGTSNERSLELFNMQLNGQRLDGTRAGKRGRRLELDRKNPSLGYDELDNLVWSCYWCNNAKSNFFSSEEFAPIGKAIGEVLKNI